LHLSGKIQGFGALVVVRLSDWTITHASDNADTFLGGPIPLFLGTDIRTVNFWSPTWMDKVPLETGARNELIDQDMVVTLIRSHEYLLIESEPVLSTAAPTPVHQLHRNLIRPPGSTAELGAYQDTLVRHILTVTGMDRVMIYQFRSDWSGEVVAEAMHGERGSYKGLRFPAGDIPAIARKLYEQNPIRTIPDVGGQEHTIRSIVPHAPDLSYSDLRSVSPMHLKYLANMGVSASLSVPVRVADRLWGLVVAHSYQGRHLLSHDQRHSATLLTNAFALGLASYKAAESLRLVDAVDRNVHSAMVPLLQTESPIEFFADCAQALQALMAADGVAIAVGERAAISGGGLSLDALAELDRWFIEDHQDTLLMTDRLCDASPSVLSVAMVYAGTMAVKIWSAKHGWLRFYWFRLSETQEITWAGNPDKPPEFGSHALSPRLSFEKWVEIRHGYSSEWTSGDRLSALRVRSIAGRLM
jgi:light-regulated signal transduction histidine kinase (bacteriophytochrome)